VVALSIIPAVLSHRWIEEPLRRSQLHVLRPRRTLAYVPASAALVIALAVTLPLLQPSIPTLAADKAKGAPAMGPDAAVQTRASALRPTPRRASRDRSRAYTDGCLVDERGTRSPACTYGRKKARTSIALFGDSHAMQYFPAMNRVAKGRGWRLLELTKAGCPASAVHVHNAVLRRAYRECDAWRAHTLRRIERERPKVVVVSSATFYRVVQRGRKLGARAGEERLREGWITTLRRLRATGAKVVVLEDNPRPPRDVLTCVAGSLESLDRCAFPRSAGLAFPHVASEAAVAVDGVALIDPTPKFCLADVCPAVIGDVLVYRNGGHVTATYAATMWRWLGRRLPR
jgi:hypothetical protein